MCIQYEYVQQPKPLSITEGLWLLRVENKKTQSNRKKLFYMKSKLLEDPLGSMLYKFFTQCTTTHENENYLTDILWRAVRHYRLSGEFSVVVVVCPQYSSDYKRLLSGVSLTAERSINLFAYLKTYMQRHIRYNSKVQFNSLLFDQESVEFMDILKSQADVLMTESVQSIKRVISKRGDLPASFTADKLVGEDMLSEWQRLIVLSRKLLSGDTTGSLVGLPFGDLEELFKSLKPFFARVMNTDDDAAHRKLFFEEDGPAYLSAGHWLRKRYGAHTLQIDVGSNARFAQFNLWQPPGEELTDQPALIRIKDPGKFNSK